MKFLTQTLKTFLTKLSNEEFKNWRLPIKYSLIIDVKGHVFF